jgi:hypothetical protein
VEDSIWDKLEEWISNLNTFFNKKHLGKGNIIQSLETFYSIQIFIKIENKEEPLGKVKKINFKLFISKYLY